MFDKKKEYNITLLFTTSVIYIFFWKKLQLYIESSLQHDENHGRTTCNIKQNPRLSHSNILVEYIICTDVLFSYRVKFSILQVMRDAYIHSYYHGWYKDSYVLYMSKKTQIYNLYYSRIRTGLNYFLNLGLLSCDKFWPKEVAALDQIDMSFVPKEYNSLTYLKYKYSAFHLPQNGPWKKTKDRQIQRSRLCKSPFAPNM